MSIFWVNRLTSVIRLTHSFQALCGLFLLAGLLVSAFMAVRDGAPIIIAFLIVLPLLFLFMLAALGSVVVLIHGVKRDRIGLAIWYALAVVFISLFASMDMLNEPAPAIGGMLVAATMMIFPIVWLRKSA